MKTRPGGRVFVLDNSVCEGKGVASVCGIGYNAGKFGCVTGCVGINCKRLVNGGGCRNTAQLRNTGEVARDRQGHIQDDERAYSQRRADLHRGLLAGHIRTMLC